MEQFGNLKYQNVPILLNNPSADNINFYFDTIEDTLKMFFPKVGVTIPLDGTTRMTASLPNIATKKIVGLEVNGLCPCQECNFEYGLSVELMPPKPGVDNDYYYPKMAHLYSKILKLSACSSGYMAIVDQKTMINEVHRQMNADPDLTPYIECEYMYILSEVDAENDGFAIDGTKYLAGATLKDTIEVKEALIAGSATGVEFIPTSETTGIILLDSTKRGAVISAEGDAKINGTATTADIVPKLYFRSLTEDWDFNLKIDETNFKKLPFSYAEWPKIDAAINTYVAVGDVFLKATSTDNDAFGQALRKTDGSAGAFKDVANFYAGYSDTVDKEFTTVYLPNKNISVFPEITKDVDPTSVYGAKTVFKQLTADDVWKVFANNAHLGALSNLVRQDKPVNEEFVRFTLVYDGHKSNSFHGASQGGNAQQRVTFYVPYSKIDDHIYNGSTLPTSGSPTPLSGASADKSLGELITALSSGSKITKVGNWLDFLPQ